ncbi:hypothetical protein NL676_035461 [Syzygium grande]|nr:hypothetical protein NL676_035461 [Syzygium grande]
MMVDRRCTVERRWTSQWWSRTAIEVSAETATNTEIKADKGESGARNSNMKSGAQYMAQRRGLEQGAHARSGGRWCRRVTVFWLFSISRVFLTFSENSDI